MRIIFLALAATILAPSIAPAQESAKQPNVIVILVDDMGFSDLACYGSEIPTPNLDKLGWVPTPRCAVPRVDWQSTALHSRSPRGPGNFPHSVLPCSRPGRGSDRRNEDDRNLSTLILLSGGLGVGYFSHRTVEHLFLHFLHLTCY